VVQGTYVSPTNPQTYTSYPFEDLGEGSYRTGPASDIAHPVHPSYMELDLLDRPVPTNQWWSYEEVFPFDKDFLFIINLAVGGSWGGSRGVEPLDFPTTFEVDYLRMYQYDYALVDVTNPTHQSCTRPIQKHDPLESI
jgi:hypothetical protein